MYYKLVDQSHSLSKTDTKSIDSKDKLYRVLKNYLDNLFADAKADNDSKIFWATYSFFVIKKDAIYFRSNLGTHGFSIYDVNVKKSDRTSILIEPYKIDGLKDYSITNLERPNKCAEYNYIPSSKIIDIKEDLDQCWEGTVTIRSNFTGWNIININVDMNGINDNEICSGSSKSLSTDTDESSSDS